ncbi:unnamed protein product [Protopolystoma xenopodis]|uniref:Uncharacterized protein n=1 Tax=Protopolystoma xenopodis TaxID=117903 RepID=A0A3S5AE40_9PLAT|nr:unnamed protein product [Protopolystoma xenopodis]
MFMRLPYCGQASAQTHDSLVEARGETKKPDLLLVDSIITEVLTGTSKGLFPLLNAYLATAPIGRQCLHHELADIYQYTLANRLIQLANNQSIEAPKVAITGLTLSYMADTDATLGQAFRGAAQRLISSQALTDCLHESRQIASAVRHLGAKLWQLSLAIKSDNGEELKNCLNDPIFAFGSSKPELNRTIGDLSYILPTRILRYRKQLLDVSLYYSKHF